MALKIRRGDTVMVIAGKDRGKKGKVQKVLPRERRVIIEDINMVRKHRKPTRQVMQGGIIEQPAPLDISNVMLVCRRCGEPTRIGSRRLEDGSRTRVCRKCGEVIDA